MLTLLWSGAHDGERDSRGMAQPQPLATVEAGSLTRSAEDHLMRVLFNPVISKVAMLYHWKYRNLMVDHTLKVLISEVF